MSFAATTAPPMFGSRELGGSVSGLVAMESDLRQSGYDETTFLQLIHYQKTYYGLTKSDGASEFSISLSKGGSTIAMHGDGRC